MNELDDFLPREDLNEQELFVQFRNKLQNPKVYNIGVISRYGAEKCNFISIFFDWYKRNGTIKRILVFSNNIVNISGEVNFTLIPFFY